MESTPSVEAAIRRWGWRLDSAFDDIRRCVVVVEHAHDRRGRGTAFLVGIRIAVPDRTIVVPLERSGGFHEPSDNIYVAVADAFRVALQQLRARASLRQPAAKSAVLAY